MALEWFLGDKGMSSNALGASVSSSYRINAGDVDDLRAAIAAKFPVTRVRRARRVYDRHEPADGPDIQNLEFASDPDLGSFMILGYASSSAEHAHIAVHLGSQYPAEVHVGSTSLTQGGGPDGNDPEMQKLLERIEQILTGGRRRMPRWAAVRLTKVGTIVALAVLLAGVAWSTWPNVALLIVSALAVTAFGWQALARLAAWGEEGATGDPASRRHGRVRVDPTNWARVRTDRASRHRDAWVAAVSVAGTLLAAVIPVYLGVLGNR
ncbi:hypothetical protein [Cellulomonas endometrii]|uniref:hypothetical protein n=1 Tax=Cellulomonas endometrii TaxID=3036301 RepID=UPI0024AD7F3B|nr:hypothetical protein [Cellulomonas endometrii]